ncbi:hypothetical protein bpr_II059 (plasmid) [Butyrivibrio proteoclasticus B316]|uniref:Uncharacterized protein n=1 Tax=Butyrivibrio proteoclasticus (strain ATCC 51982 / DSM 14932 / B316) TaxID=515622 RepID=E0S3L7_BUTPB|nr:hypothetical protein [Butyrivibrio proteoclasticus]ADL35999.1 hypothetical protein bpr_II059 [Butyrivibrio proteoclasticus B316]
MNFDQALMKMKQEEPCKEPVNIVITFDSKEYGGKGFTTLQAPRYYKEKEQTMAVVKRAWECFCNGSEEKLNSITGISVESATSIVVEKNKKKIPA